MSEEEKNGHSHGFTAFLVGGLLGAAVGLLYAPRSGEETRRVLFDTSQELKGKALNTAQEAKAAAQSAVADAGERLGTFSEESKVRLGKLQEIGKSTLKEQKESLKTGLEDAKKAVAEPVNTGTASTSPRRTSTVSGDDTDMLAAAQKSGWRRLDLTDYPGVHAGYAAPGHA